MRSRKFSGHCDNCRKSLCEEHAYFQVDENDEAITKASPYLCKDCYKEKYGTLIKNDVDIFKDNIINNLERVKRENHIEKIKIENLIEYIKEI